MAQFTPGQGWNTTQAKSEISRFLAANLTLREGTVTPATGDVAAWLLTGARQGAQCPLCHADDAGAAAASRPGMWRAMW